MISDVTPMHEPVVLEGDAGPIVAIVTELMVEPINVGVVLFSPGGYTISAQRNRWALGMAEQLAAAGLHTIRFDYHGIGDSAADLERFEQDRPLVGDGTAAIDELARRGVTDLILVGQCFGARTALAIAPDIAGLCGVFAISPSLRDLGRGEGTANRMAHDAAVGAYLKQAARVVEFSQLQDPTTRRRYLRLGSMFIRARWSKVMRRLRLAKQNPTPWVSSALVNQLTNLADRDVPVTFVFGGAETDSNEFEAAKVGPLGDAVRRSKRIVDHTLAGRVHNLGRVDIQQKIVEMIVEFSMQCAKEATSSR